MPRHPRIVFANAWYHVMNRGADYQAIFRNQEDYGLFLSLLGEITERYGIEIHAYCLMGNHYHLLIRTPAPTLSSALRHLSSVYTKCFNRAAHRDGPLFRSRFKSIIIDAESYLVQVCRYIHRNPLEAKLVNVVEDYPWSSYHAYINAQKKPPWLLVNEIPRMLSHHEPLAEFIRLHAYERQVNLDQVYGLPCHSKIIGSRAFEISLVLVGAMSPSEVHVKDTGQVHHIIEMVAQHFGMTHQQIRRGSDPDVFEARIFAMHIAKYQSGLAQVEIAPYFNISASAMSIALKRQTALLNRPNIKKVIDQITSSFRKREF